MVANGLLNRVSFAKSTAAKGLPYASSDWLRINWMDIVAFLLDINRWLM